MKVHIIYCHMSRNRDHWFKSSCCHTKSKGNLIPLSDFIKIMSINKSILCKYCITKAKNEFKMDPDNPQYALALLRLHELGVKL